MHYKMLPLLISDQQINQYLTLHKTGQLDRKTPSDGYFKQAVFGLRYMFKTFGIVDRKIGMPIMKRKKPLQEIMNLYEVMQLLMAPKLIKHKIAFALAYGSGLRINELVNVQTRDIDLVRKVVHVKNGKGGYDLLFKAAWKTIATFANDPKFLGAQIGMTAVLHTWSQNMGLHPHLHCIVPGGGISTHGKWKYTKSKGKYLFPVKAMIGMYKGIFMAELKNLHKLKIIELPYPTKEQLYKANWVIYAKQPFAGPSQVIKYLGRYSHKVAISNHRIIDYDDQKVIFKWKNYRNAAKQEVMQISSREFLRRLSLHVLPHKFVRIRHYGILSYYGRAKVIPKI